MSDAVISYLLNYHIPIIQFNLVETLLNRSGKKSSSVKANISLFCY